MGAAFFKPGVLAALASAFLFGAGTPLAKSLLDSVSPWLLAGLLYLGSGLGLALYRLIRDRKADAEGPHLEPGEWRWLVAAVLCGGVIAPVLLMAGLANMPASHAALLLNAEAVLTALIAWVVFKENFDRRIAMGMAAIVTGAAVLSWPGGAAAAGASMSMAALWPALAVLAACLFWALDNNFTRKVSLADASWIACVKGLTAGATNLLLAVALGASWPGLVQVPAAMAVGFFAYGVSLALFVVGLRHLGTARAGAYFSCAPFVGAVVAVLLLKEPVSWQLMVTAVLMAFGVWLHLTEHHAHTHAHEPLEHEHVHTHGADSDQHHTHEHTPAFKGEHAHRHRHEPVRHTHAHYPDAHHRHEH